MKLRGSIEINVLCKIQSIEEPYSHFLLISFFYLITKNVCDWLRLVSIIDSQRILVLKHTGRYRIIQFERSCRT